MTVKWYRVKLRKAKENFGLEGKGKAKVRQDKSPPTLSHFVPPTLTIPPVDSGGDAAQHHHEVLEVSLVTEVCHALHVTLLEVLHHAHRHARTFHVRSDRVAPRVQRVHLGNALPRESQSSAEHGSHVQKRTPQSDVNTYLHVMADLLVCRVEKLW